MSDSIIEKLENSNAAAFSWIDKDKKFFVSAPILCIHGDGEYLSIEELAQLGQELIDLANSKGKK
jgi:hypothetical protein